MADAVWVECLHDLGFLDYRWLGQCIGSYRHVRGLACANAADRTRGALCAVHVARRSDFPGILFAHFRLHAAKIVALLREGEAGRWNFTILISCRWCYSHRWWERCCCCSCRATAKMRIA